MDEPVNIVYESNSLPLWEESSSSVGGYKCVIVCAGLEAGCDFSGDHAPVPPPATSQEPCEN